MKEGRYRFFTGMIVVGAALLALVLVAGGFSAVITPKADGAGDLENAAGHDGVFRPYLEVDFDYVAFSGLYLTDDKDNIEVWVMWGFTRDAVTCFYQKADGKDIDGDGVFNEDDAPADAYDISYILRAPEPSYAEHNEWAVSSSRADTAEYYGLSGEESEALFSDGVLSAARKDRMIAQMAAGAGLVLIIAGAAMFVLKWKKERDRARCGDVPQEDDSARAEPQPSRPYRLGRDFASRNRLRFKRSELSGVENLYNKPDVSEEAEEEDEWELETDESEESEEEDV